MEEDKKIKFKKISKKVIKFISYSLIMILMLLASFLIFYVVSTKIYLNSGKNPPFGLYTIVSPSMEPNIMVNDAIFIKTVDPKKLEVGDIITFYSSNPFFGNTTITHRIIEIIPGEELMFRVKGDANKIADEELVLESNIVGKVLFIVPKLGQIQYFLASKGALLIAILIPAAAILGYDIYKFIKILLLKKEMKEIGELEQN